MFFIDKKFIKPSLIRIGKKQKMIKLSVLFELNYFCVILGLKYTHYILKLLAFDCFMFVEENYGYLMKKN